MSRKVLVVDNDFFFVEFLSELLEKRGYEIVKAYDGKEGISKLEEGPFHVVFVDMIMPKVSGKDLIGLVRKRFPGGKFPIVAVSGILMEQSDKLDEIGASYYIVKGPLEQMQGEINAYLEKIESGSSIESLRTATLRSEGSIPLQVISECLDTLESQKDIIEGMGVGFILVDNDAKIIKANKFATDLLKKPVESLLNYPIARVFSGEDRAKVISALKKVALDRKSRKATVQITLDGRRIFLVASLFRIEGKDSGWIIILADIND